MITFRKILTLLFCGLSSLLLLSQNPVAEFYGNGNYPVWTDNIRWTNQINMQTYDFGKAGLKLPATDFQKFEFARDILYQQGGGVLYYPAGSYDFTNVPENISDGEAGRGLMLRSGVVILGEKPTADNAISGTLQPLTKFIFKTKKIKDINNNDRSIPVNWNIVGCIPSGSETLKDI
ncbi:MAG: hypothetical protein KBG33_05475, partial [Paludibacteraceae bacterium]|nr:hypothetical protein [Paludibacteraceae bacterium]